MATGPQQKRKELRDKRLNAEAASKGVDRRENMIKIVGVAAFIAIIAIVVAIVALSGGSDDGSSSKSSSDVTAQLAGIPQNGTILGDPKSDVTLVEFGDMQCPICQQYADDVLPDIIGGPIKAGDANLEFKQWAILGEDSSLAGKAALAAAEQGRYFEFIETFYADQGLEGSGYVTDDFLTGIAEDAGVEDIDKWNVDREAADLDQILLMVDNQASELGLTGTPSFAVRGPDGDLTVVQANSTDPQENVKTLKDAIKEAGGGK